MFTTPERVNLEISDAELEELSYTGLLALNLEEMQTIQGHYRDEATRNLREAIGISPDAPTDVELECLAQTWSEHCKHKIFASKIHHIDTETGEDSIIDSIFKTYIMKPTHDMQNEVDWLLSVFHDNSGVIAWDEQWSLCMKAETHNSPSALRPLWGSNDWHRRSKSGYSWNRAWGHDQSLTQMFSAFGPPDWEGDLPDNLFHPSTSSARRPRRSSCWRK